MKTLSDIAEVIVGQITQRVAGEKTEEGNVRVLVPKAISEGTIDDNSLDTLNLSKDVSDDKYTKEGDVVIKLSTPFEAAYIDKDHEGLLIPSFCAVVRFVEGYDPKGMCAILNSTYIQDQVKAMIGGAIRPMVKVTDLRAVEIPDFKNDDLKKLGDEYIKSGEKRRILVQLAENERQIMDNTVLGLIKEALS